jgi:polyhydroxyalkanoate synthesis regulator phasin
MEGNMQQDEMGLLFIKHCSNFQRVSVGLLQAIKQEKVNMVAELTAQKQIIMDSMVALQGQFNINDCQPDIREKVKELLRQITISENEGQQIIKERCAEISKKMIANRKEMNIQQAYEEQSFQGSGILCDIEK